MAGITVSGIGSGLDINTIVTDLINAEKTPATERLDTKEATIQAQLSGIGTFQSELSAFRSALNSINSVAKIQNVRATVSNENLFTANATSIAQAGSYNVEVQQMAQTQKLVTDETQRFTAVTDVVGTGTLTFQVGRYDGSTFTADPAKATKTITIDASNNTLEGVRDAINKADGGARASIINDGQGYRLVISASNSGAANSLKITVDDTGDANSTDQSGLSRLAYDPEALAGSGKNMTQTIQAQDALLKVDGLDISSASNSVVGVVPGVTLNLKSPQVGTTVTLTVAQDTTATIEAVDSFVTAYNNLIETADSLTFYDTKTKERGILAGDSNVRSIISQVRNIITGAVAGTTGAQQSLSAVGVSLQKDGTLNLDSSKLQTALSADPESVAALFTRTGRPTDPLVSYNTASSTSAAGIYNLKVTQLATQGLYTGAVVGAGTFNITGSTDNSFAIKVNGFSASAAIILNNGTYTGADMAAEMQRQINADSTLASAGATVSVSYATDHFVFTSAAYGSASNVEFTQANVNLGISVGIGTAGLNVAGRMTSATQATDQGQYTGATVSGTANSFTIGATNHTFAIRVDGTQANAAITLTSGTYTGAEMAAELQNQINADSAFISAGATVNVNYDSSNNRFVFTSNAQSATSDVEITEANSSLGIGPTGSGRTLTGNGVSAGITVDVLGGITGDRGTLALSDGVAQRLDRVIGNFLSSDGPLSNRTNSLNLQVEQIDNQRTALNARMDALETRYRAQFTRMDTLVSSLTATSTYLTQQFFTTSSS